ncbi:MAG: 1,4-dihydroxy-6-naphthoate synthase [Desulfobulbaceae bacterium]|nr:1,4-dihydroxy-6-naphthoate synthase [Desulfobulbaceae bacterium]
MLENLTIGYSPCPNDTYIFYGLTHGEISLNGLSFAPPFLEDVETLNEWALRGKLDITKLSFHALGHVLDDYVMLSAGAALGRGCGPLLVTRSDLTSTDPQQWTIAIPGAHTTAAMLLKLYLPQVKNLQVMRFDQIMEAVRAGKVDAGVIIHESRFTYQEYDLTSVKDLGSWWEEETGLPIPLGCIAARRSLGHEVIGKIDRAIQASLVWANQHPDSCGEYIRDHAQELDDEVTRNHINLYVNDFSLNIGKEGRAAVTELLRRGREASLFSHPETTPWLSD